MIWPCPQRIFDPLLDPILPVNPVDPADAEVAGRLEMPIPPHLEL
jgi:hypothetical protein